MLLLDHKEAAVRNNGVSKCAVAIVGKNVKVRHFEVVTCSREC